MFMYKISTREFVEMVISELTRYRTEFNSNHEKSFVLARLHKVHIDVYISIVTVIIYFTLFLGPLLHVVF